MLIIFSFSLATDYRRLVTLKATSHNCENFPKEEFCQKVSIILTFSLKFAINRGMKVETLLKTKKKMSFWIKNSPLNEHDTI